MIQLDHISHGFADRALLQDVSLTIKPGQRVGLSGPSASGKTTLLNLVAGLIAPDQGRIYLNGVLASSPGCVLVPPYQRGIGFVFQSPALWPHMNVAQNVLFGLGGHSRADRAKLLEQALQATGCVDIAGRHPDSLSGGEQRRVALARALAPKPNLLLLDEPLSNLDKAARRDLLGLIAAAAETTQASVVFVSHDPSEARCFCTRFLTLDCGRIGEEEQSL